MQSSRDAGHVEILLPCQTFDPGRGSFMVHPLAVKKGEKVKKIPNPSWVPGYSPDHLRYLDVFRSANHIEYDSRGIQHAEPHPESYEFAVDYSRR